MQINHRLTPILARAHQLDGHVVCVGVGVELRVPTKNAHVSLVWKIDGHFGFVGNRVQ